MKGYKGMKSDMTCREMQFEIGKTYHVDGDIELCSNGLHFCQRLVDVFSYYDDDNDRYFEVETDTEVKTDGNKSVTAELKIIREITSIEVNQAIYGNGNGDGDGYGYGNGYGYGYGNGNGYGYGNGHGCGDGYDYGTNIQKILEFN